MGIEGLGKTYDIPPIKKEQEPGMHKEQKERKKRERKKTKDEKNHTINNGRVDIRI